jgi:tetratricopeptide (TPR) repeat protein
MSTPHSEPDALGAVAEAFLARYRKGERPSLTEYTDKHPELAEQIRDVFPALVVIEELGSVGGPRQGLAATADQGKAPEQLDDFRILREVGRGGMGIVYEAVQMSLGRHVALKVFSCHGLLPPTHLERFRREARAAARLHHPNIVPVHGVGERAGLHFYAMQFIQGRGLDEVLKEVKRLRDPKHPPAELEAAPLVSADPAAAVTSAAGATSGTELTSQPEAQYFRSVAEMGAQVAAGLDYAHKQCVLHRDIKPSNLLLDARGTVWITDFGLAKAEGTDELTHTGDIVGTLRYMAPERLRGWSDPRSDVYALGITLYELLTLRPAFADSSRPRLIERVAHEDPIRPRKIDRAIPRDLETIVLRAIDKEPERRYATAAELAEDLGRYLAGEPVWARRIGVCERGAKWIKRRPAVAALLAVCAVAALLVALGMLWTVRDRAAQSALLAEGVRHALEEVRSFYEHDRQPDAMSALKRAEAMLAGDRGTPELRYAVQQWRTDLEMVTRVEQIRLDKAAMFRDEQFAPQGAAEAYKAAFDGYGLNLGNVDPRAAAASIQAGAIKSHLLAALDDWISLAPETGRPAKAHLLAVARAADDDPWRDRVRSVLGQDDGKSLEMLAQDRELQSRPASTQWCLARGLAAIKKTAVALQVLQQAQKRYPDDFWVNLELAQLLLGTGQALEAVRYYQAALALRPGNYAVHLHLGTALAELRDYARAEAEYRTVLDLKPGLVAAHANLCIALRLQGRLDDAIVEGERAVRLKPNDANGRNSLGNALLDKKQSPQALAQFEQAVSLKPHFVPALVNLGRALAQLGKWDEAIGKYRSAIAINPDVAAAHANLAHALERDEAKLGEAIQEYRQALRCGPNDAMLLNELGDLLQKHGKLDEAIAEYVKALALQPAHALSHYNLARALYGKKRLDEAMAHYREVLRLYPQHAEAHFGLANALRDRRDTAGAIASYRQALELNPRLAQAHNSLGSLLCDVNRDYDRAAAHFRLAIELTPKEPNCHYNLGNALRGQGDVDGAIASYRRAVELDPKLHRAHNGLGGLLCDVKHDYVGAAAHFRLAIQQVPTEPIYHCNLGNALRWQGYLQQAAASYRDALRHRPDFGPAQRSLRAVEKQLSEKAPPQ